MNFRAHLGTTLLALGVTGALIYGFLPRPVPVELATAKKGPFAVSVEEEGKTRLLDRYVISAPISGYAQRISLEVGDSIKSGQTIAIIEPARSDALDPRARTQAKAQAQAAEAALEAARQNARVATTQAQLASQELQRIEALHATHFVSPQDLDRARAEVRRTKAASLASDHAVNVSHFELEMAKAALMESSRLQEGAPQETVAVKTPIDARVLKIAHESEGAVQAGTPLIEIGDPSALEVEVEVLSTQAVKISPGTKVLLDRWGGDKTLEGMVRIVEPVGFTKISALGVEEQRVRVIVDMASPQQDWMRLGDGYRVEARFVVWEGKDILQIPASALFRYNSGWAVFLESNGQAKLTPVSLGQRAGLWVQINDGLSTGDKLISHPDDKIQDGVRIKAR